jgi:DNA-binding transcriptional MerR regulator
MKIADICSRYGLTADTLRYYEREGLLPPVSRSSGGYREYNETDCLRVEFIRCMRGAGMSVAVLAEYRALLAVAQSWPIVTNEKRRGRIPHSAKTDLDRSKVINHNAV